MNLLTLIKLPEEIGKILKEYRKIIHLSEHYYHEKAINGQLHCNQIKEAEIHALSQIKNLLDKEIEVDEKKVKEILNKASLGDLDREGKVKATTVKRLTHALSTQNIFKIRRKE